MRLAYTLDMTGEKNSRARTVIPFPQTSEWPNGVNAPWINRLQNAKPDATTDGTGPEFGEEEPGIPGPPQHCWTSLILENYLALRAEDAKDARRLLRQSEANRFRMSMARLVCLTALAMAALLVVFLRLRSWPSLATGIVFLAAGFIAGAVDYRSLEGMSE